MSTPYPVANDLVNKRSFWRANKWLILRRSSQIFLLALFLTGPWFGVWITKGNLNYSLTLDLLPLADPYIFLQSLVAGHTPELELFLAAAIVLVFYLLVGGRTYCAWVCPVNLVTDAASVVRKRFGLLSGTQFSRRSRYYILAATFVVAAATQTIVWDLVNPVTILHRGIIFGMGLGWIVILGIFVLDLFISRDGWCGRLCPVGAFYSLLNFFSPLRVAASKPQNCDDCADCYAICPEPKIIHPVLKDKTHAQAIESALCTKCGRCIDVCPQDVFQLSLLSRNGGEATP
jgi:ferredoxin-type protein NapH